MQAMPSTKPSPRRPTLDEREALVKRLRAHAMTAKQPAARRKETLRVASNLDKRNAMRRKKEAEKASG